MTPRAGDSNTQSTAAESAVDDCFRAGTFEGDCGFYPRCVGRFLQAEKVPHSPQVPFTFFTDIGRKENRAGRKNLSVFDSSSQSKQSGEARSVVASARGEDFLLFFARPAVGACWEDGVQVGGKEDYRGVVCAGELG